jgi:hypothetical protein
MYIIIKSYIYYEKAIITIWIFEVNYDINNIQKIIQTRKA